MLTKLLIVLSIAAFVFLFIGIIVTISDAKKRHDAEHAKHGF